MCNEVGWSDITHEIKYEISLKLHKMRVTRDD